MSTCSPPQPPHSPPQPHHSTHFTVDGTISAPSLDSAQSQSHNARSANPPCLPLQQLLVSLGHLLLQLGNLGIQLKQDQMGVLQLHSPISICMHAHTAAPFLSSSVSSWLWAMYWSSLSFSFFSSEATFEVASDNSTLDPPSVPPGADDVMLQREREEGGRGRKHCSVGKSLDDDRHSTFSYLFAP